MVDIDSLHISYHGLGQGSEVVEEPDTGLCWEASEEPVEHRADPDNLVAAGHS